MPIYDFACGHCSNRFEELIPMDAAPPACPTCGQVDQVARVPGARVTITKKEDTRPPNIKSFTRPRRW